MAAVNPADGAAKLAVVFKPMLDQVKEELKSHVTVQLQDLAIALDKVHTKIDVLEKLVGEKKKTVREKKDVAAPAAGAEVQVQQPAGAQKSFASNKLVWFRDLYKNNETFRTKYATAEVRALMDKDEEIRGKKNDQQRLTAEATFVWNWIKQNRKDVMSEIDTAFDEAKKAHEAANKPQQATAEAHTPPPAAAAQQV